MIDTIIFDVGNVLLQVENDYIQKDISKTLNLNHKVVKSAWNKLIPNYLGKGKITEKEFWQKFFKITNSQERKIPKDLLYRELHKRFTIFPGVIEIVKKLKENNYKLGIISDTIESHARESEKHGLFNNFGVVILSYQVGLRKTDLKIFKLALKNLYSKPQNSVFIDDIVEYVKTARKLGINGIVFKNPKQLKNSLKKLGVKISTIFEREETNIGAHALLITKDNRILLQQRTSDKYITNPGKISMFGGTIKKRESTLTGLKREIAEELNLKIKDDKIKKLGIYIKTKKLDGVDYTIHVFLVNDVKMEKLRLNEGLGFLTGSTKDLLRNKKLTRITRLALEDYYKLNLGQNENKL